MNRYEIIALCERWGVPKEDWRPFADFIQNGRVAKRLGRRLVGRYEPILAEVLAILNRKQTALVTKNPLNRRSG